MDNELVSQIVGALYIAKRATFLLPEKPSEIKKGQFGLLAALYRIKNEEGKARVSDITEALKARNPNIIKAINHSVSMGLLKRSKDVSDKRVVYVEFTEAGIEFYQNTLMVLHENLMEYFKLIEDDKWLNMIETVNMAYQMIENVSLERKRTIQL